MEKNPRQGHFLWLDCGWSGMENFGEIAKAHQDFLCDYFRIPVPEGEYVVFEHGPFDYARENSAVEGRIEAAMRGFDFAAAGYSLDLTPGRVFYFFHDPARFWKYIRPVRRCV